MMDTGRAEYIVKSVKLEVGDEAIREARNKNLRQGPCPKARSMP